MDKQQCNNFFDLSNPEEIEGKMYLIKKVFKKYGHQLQQYQHAENSIIFYLSHHADLMEFVALVKNEIADIVRFKTSLQLYFDQNGLRMGLKIN